MAAEGKFDHEFPGAGTENPLLAALSAGSGRLRVQLEIRIQGRDFLLLVTGGEAHVGAVAVCDGRRANGKSVVTEMPGHREGPLAGECAEILARATRKTVAAVVGIHQDNATGQEIAAIVANVRQAATELAATVRTKRGKRDD
jgi:hypothetical protein